MTQERREGLTPEEIRREAELISEELKKKYAAQKDGGRRYAWLGAGILGVLVILMAVPYYSVKLNPEPDMEAISAIIAQLNTVNTQRAGSIIEKSFGRKKGENDLAYLAGKVSATTKRTADIIVSAACRKNAGGEENRVCHAKAIYYFVRNAMQYTGDPPDEYFKSAEESLQTLTGDCDDHAILLSNLLSAGGIRTRLVAVPNHVYVEAYLQEAPSRYKKNDGWISLDATCKTCSFGELAPETATKEKNRKRYIYI